MVGFQLATKDLRLTAQGRCSPISAVASVNCEIRLRTRALSQNAIEIPTPQGFGFGFIQYLFFGLVFAFIAPTSLWAQTVQSEPPLSGGAQTAPPTRDDESPSGGISKAAADAENPIARMVSIPFQNNSYFDVGRYHNASNTLLVEPVVPFRLNDDWNLITRTIVPVVYEPQFIHGQGPATGLGNIEPQFYFSPSHTGKFFWGVGPHLWLPSATNRELGVNKRGGGPRCRRVGHRRPMGCRLACE